MSLVGCFCNVGSLFPDIFYTICNHLTVEEGTESFFFSLVCGLCTVCLSLFAVPLVVIGGFCSMIVAIS